MIVTQMRAARRSAILERTLPTAKGRNCKGGGRIEQQTNTEIRASKLPSLVSDLCKQNRGTHGCSLVYATYMVKSSKGLTNKARFIH